QTVYGVGYLQQQDMTKVRRGQVIHLDISPHQASKHSLLDAKISDISTVSNGALYSVRADLPADLVTSSGLRLSFEHEMQTQGEIVTQKKKLFGGLFSVFRTLLGHG
ncbi:MAG: hypothetical protein ACRD4L_09280, partial [Pyrinomonadaceae bacterium]